MENIVNGFINEKKLLGKWKLTKVSVHDSKANKDFVIPGVGWLELMKNKEYGKYYIASWRASDGSSRDVVTKIYSDWGVTDNKLMLDDITDSAYSQISEVGFYVKEFADPNEAVNLYPSEVYDLEIEKNDMQLSTKQYLLDKVEEDTPKYYSREYTYTFEKVK